MKKNRGITLIALVITIVLMLILASITVNLVINGDLFENAGNAKFVTEVMSIKEQVMQRKILAKDQLLDGEIDEILGKKTDYDDILAVQKGKLVYYANNVKEQQKDLLEEMGITEKIPTILELISDYKIKVGDYVNYEPDVGIYKVVDGVNGTGVTTDEGYQKFETEDLKWRILSINEQTGEIELVSEIQSSTILWLEGANGYNHGVDILNDLCETLYSNKKGATARSITEEDINKKSTYKHTAGSDYGKVISLANAKIPNLYLQELGSTENGLEETTDLIETNERVEKGKVNKTGVTEYKKYTGTTQMKSFYATYTGYYYGVENLNTGLGINNAPRGLLKTGGDFWLASRCFSTYNNSFAIAKVYSANFVFSQALYSAGGAVWGQKYSYRPVVMLDKQVLLTIDEENTTNTVTYWDIKW